MERSILFSIVIPIYNAEAYLSDAIEDVLHQSYPHWELLLVDDASSDNSKSIAERYEEKDVRIRVIYHTSNQGVAKTRNTGIKCAKGDYLLMLDADDRYDPRLLERVAKSIAGPLAEIEAMPVVQDADTDAPCPPDVVVYGCREEYYDASGRKKYDIGHSLKTEWITDAGRLHQVVMELNKETLYGYPWNKAYRCKYLQEGGYLFEDYAFGEDILFNISVFQKLKSLAVLSDELYHYINREDAGEGRLTTKYVPEYFAQQKLRVQSLREQQKKWSSLDEKTHAYLAEEYFRAFFSMMEREYAHGTSPDEILRLASQEQQGEMFQTLSPHLPEAAELGTMKGYMFTPIQKGDFKKTMRHVKQVSFVRKNFSGLFARLKQNR